MALIGTIALGMSVDPSGLKRGLGSAKREIGGFASQAGSLGLGLGGVLAGAAAGLGAFRFLRDGVLAASDLNETLSKTKAILGNASSVVEEQGAALAKSFGVNRNEYLTAAGNFAAVFKGVGDGQDEAAKIGNTLGKLALDIASFDNVTNEEAFTSISSALRGEFDPIEKFRVFLTANAVAAEALALGLAKSKKEITESAKKHATLSLILKATKDAQGDLERTSGGAANQFRKAGGGLSEFGTQIGAVLLPAVSAATTAFNDFLATILEVFEDNRPTIEGWGETLTTVIGNAVFALRNFGTFWKIAELSATESIANVLAVLDTLPANFAIITGYLGRNWSQLLGDLVVGAGAAFSNLLANAANFGTALWDAIQGKGFTFEFTPLLDGFEAAAERLPELVRPAWVDMSSDINAEFAKIASKEAARADQIAKAATKDAAATTAEEAARKDAAAGPATKFAGLAQRGTAEAYKAVINATGLGKNGAIEKVAKEAPVQTKHLASMASDLKRLAALPANVGAELATL